jgi:hypothetical protein
MVSDTQTGEVKVQEVQVRCTKEIRNFGQPLLYSICIQLQKYKVFTD